MKIVYEKNLKDYMQEKKKSYILVEVASSDHSDFEVTELVTRFVSENHAEVLIRKGYRKVPGEVGWVLLPNYRLEYDDTVVFSLKKLILFHLVKQKGIRL